MPVKVLAVLAIFLTFPLVVGYMEHKVMAHMQARVGPMEAGRFHGVLQLVADGIKFSPATGSVQTPDAGPGTAEG
ncbi:MAG TPA: NADH-quinone oxidoreductase subunit H, partial [Actinomycetes bacterium]|nr:NADH-quinone oxidoreductase subunit H [Actinomycetes bacterium]